MKIREVTIEEILVFQFPAFHARTNEIFSPIESYRIDTKGTLRAWDITTDTWILVSANGATYLPVLKRNNYETPFFIFEED